MKYARQTQGALDRLDQSLARLHQFVKRGQTKAALQYMDEGELKDRFDELQNMIILSQTNNLGAAGTQNVGNI